MIRIDFEDTYALTYQDDTLMNATIIAELEDSGPRLMKVSLHYLDLRLGFDVYNLIFGPVDSDGGIDLLAKVRHKNVGKFISTVMLHALNFLKRHPAAAVGIDGSTIARTYLNHRTFLSNARYLSHHCRASGVDWYARQLRTGGLEKNENGTIRFTPRLERISHGRKPGDLYRYYLMSVADILSST